MLEPGELVDDTLLSGTPIKLEGPTATAANLVPLGDLSTRMERVQKQPQHNQHRSKENAHPQSLASYGRLSPVRFSPVGETPLPLVRAGSAPALSSGRPWAAPPLPLAPSSLKRSSESMGSSDRELAECKRRLLDHSPGKYDLACPLLDTPANPRLLPPQSPPHQCHITSPSSSKSETSTSFSLRGRKRHITATSLFERSQVLVFSSMKPSPGAQMFHACRFRLRQAAPVYSRKSRVSCLKMPGAGCRDRPSTTSHVSFARLLPR